MEERHSRKSAGAVTASRAPGKSAPRPREVRPFPPDVLERKSTVGP